VNPNKGNTMTDHENQIYRITQNTLDMCGNTLSAVQDYCLENDLKAIDFEGIRFEATMDYPHSKYELKRGQS